MQVYISNKEIAEIATSLVKLSGGQATLKFIDIDAITKYLGITVIYERIAEDDSDKIGFISNGSPLLTVARNGKKVKITFPSETIVLDKFLLRPEEENRRRFTLAHEISHLLINRADPMYSAACFNRVYDSERSYDYQELQERMTLGECQANTMAAMILMPLEVMTSSVYKHFRRKRIPIYGENVFLPEHKPLLQKMAQELGVSYTAMTIQLRKYGLLEVKDMSEYFAKTGGGNFECPM